MSRGEEWPEQIRSAFSNSELQVVSVTKPSLSTDGAKLVMFLGQNLKYQHIYHITRYRMNKVLCRILDFLYCVQYNTSYVQPTFFYQSRYTQCYLLQSFPAVLQVDWMLKALLCIRPLLSARSCRGTSAGNMPGKRKAEANTKDDDDKKKNKGQTDWDSLDFSSNAKTGDKKVI